MSDTHDQDPPDPPDNGDDFMMHLLEQQAMEARESMLAPPPFICTQTATTIWPSNPHPQPGVSVLFQAEILSQLAKGYRLHSYALDRIVAGAACNEMIVAVFEHVGTRRQ